MSYVRAGKSRLESARNAVNLLVQQKVQARLFFCCFFLSRTPRWHGGCVLQPLAPCPQFFWGRTWMNGLTFRFRRMYRLRHVAPCGFATDFDFLIFSVVCAAIIL